MNFKKLHWAIQGLIGGLIAFIILQLSHYFVFKIEITTQIFFINLFVWCLGGLGNSYFFKYLREKKWFREGNA